MNDFEFKQEMHMFVDNAFEEFSRSKRLILDTLQELHRVCINNGIIYYLAFGTMIGYKRDNGMIPWDRDLDILLPIKYKDKLISALNNDLSKEYDYIVFDTSKTFPYYMLRVFPIHYDSFLVHVDVFFLVGGPEKEEDSRKMAEKMKWMFNVRGQKMSNPRRENYKGNANFLFAKLSKYKYFWIPRFVLDKYYTYLMYKYDYDSAKYLISINDRAKCFPSDIFGNGKLVNYCGGEAYIVEKEEDYLNLVYKNYKEYLPLAERFDEFYNGYKLLCNAKHYDKNYYN